jgi:hypothetical protein
VDTTLLPYTKTVLVQINATVNEIVEELGWFVGQNGSNLAFSASGFDLSSRSSGSLDWESEGVSSAVVETGVGVVVVQESGGCGEDGDIRLAVLVQINTPREQVIIKLRIVW